MDSGGCGHSDGWPTRSASNRRRRWRLPSDLNGIAAEPDLSDRMPEVQSRMALSDTDHHARAGRDTDGIVATDAGFAVSEIARRVYRGVVGAGARDAAR